MKLEFLASVTEAGGLVLPPQLGEQIKKFFAGQEVILSVEKKSKRRTLNQNNYYWAVVVDLIRQGIIDTGELLTSSEIHDFLRFRFLKQQKVNEESGEVIYEYARSTAELMVHEFSFYLDNCIQFAAEYLSVAIPSAMLAPDYYFIPERQNASETKTDYLRRIEGYLKEIVYLESLKQYWGLNAHWHTDDEVKALFTARKNELIKK